MSSSGSRVTILFMLHFLSQIQGHLQLPRSENWTLLAGWPLATARKTKLPQKSPWGGRQSPLWTVFRVPNRRWEKGPLWDKSDKAILPPPPPPCGTATRQNQTLTQCVRTWPSQPCPIFSPRHWQHRMRQKMAWSPLGFQLHVKEMAKFPWIAHYALLNVNLTKNPFGVTHMLTETWVQHSIDTLTGC